MSTELPSSGPSQADLKQLAQRLERRGLATPALFLLEMYKPLSTVLAAIGQGLHPIIFPLFANSDYQNLIKVLEDRKLLEEFLCELEEATQNTH